VSDSRGKSNGVPTVFPSQRLRAETPQEKIPPFPQFASTMTFPARNRGIPPQQFKSLRWLVRWQFGRQYFASFALLLLPDAFGTFVSSTPKNIVIVFPREKRKKAYIYHTVK
jgi:hypothetical protein